MTYAYLYISPNETDVIAQKEAILFYAKSNNITIDKVIKNNIDGNGARRTRMLRQLLGKIPANSVLLTRDLFSLGKAYSDVIKVIRI